MSSHSTVKSAGKQSAPISQIAINFVPDQLELTFIRSNPRLQPHIPFFRDLIYEQTLGMGLSELAEHLECEVDDVRGTLHPIARNLLIASEESIRTYIDARLLVVNGLTRRDINEIIIRCSNILYRAGQTLQDQLKRDILTGDVLIEF